jgi:hypothetical protein
MRDPGLGQLQSFDTLTAEIVHGDDQQESIGYRPRITGILSEPQRVLAYLESLIRVSEQPERPADLAMRI